MVLLFVSQMTSALRGSYNVDVELERLVKLLITQRKISTIHLGNTNPIFEAFPQKVVLVISITRRGLA